MRKKHIQLKNNLKRKAKMNNLIKNGQGTWTDKLSTIILKSAQINSGDLYNSYS